MTIKNPLAGGSGGAGPAPVAATGHSQKQNYVLLATHKNKTIFHWPLAKTKPFSIGPWQKQNYLSLASSLSITIKTH